MLMNHNQYEVIKSLLLAILLGISMLANPTWWVAVLIVLWVCYGLYNDYVYYNNKPNK